MRICVRDRNASRMPILALAVSSLADVLVGGIFVLVGGRVLAREVEPEARAAMRMFGLWWFGIAGSTTLAGLSLDGGVLGLVASWVGVERVPAGVVLAALLAWTLLACVGLYGLLVYLAYLFRGRSAAMPLGIAYALLYALFASEVVAEAPQGLRDNGLGVVVRYAAPAQGLALLALLALLVLPQIGGALAYGSLFFRTHARAARYRIALVAVSLVAWLGLSLAASAAGFGTQQAWLVAERALAVAAALLILVAYAPPRWIRARYLGDPEADAHRVHRMRLLDERVRQLV